MTSCLYRKNIRQVLIASMLMYIVSFMLGFDSFLRQPFSFEYDVQSSIGCNFKLHVHINR